MRKIITVPLIAIFILLSSFSMTAIADDSEDPVREFIRIKVMTMSGDSAGPCRQDGICESPMLSRFYTERDFRPAWISNPARLAQIESLLNVIRDADQEGLRPQDYHLDKLKKAIDDWRRLSDVNDKDFDRLADIDLLLTDAFFRLGLHLYSGRIDYRSLSPEWGADRKDADLVYILENALEYGDVGVVLRGFVPRHRAYADLKEALRCNRAVAAAGGWPQIPGGTTFKKGKRGIPVIMLHERLLASDDLKPQENAVSYIFDHSLEEAVCKFQRRRGLKDDGKVGPETLQFLNMPVEEIIRRIELNMDRLRWLPDDLGERYVLVNIADYSLELIDHEQSILDMRIIAGADKKRSYIFSDKITYLELNPFWNIPDSITQKEMLRQIKKNPQFLNVKKIKIIKGWSEPPMVVPPDKINWSAINARNFRYRLRQEPGPGNPLGRIKFMFPNKYDVYLHDTTEKHLFNKKKRTLSHGCIRIEKPLDLAVNIFPPDQGWTQKKFLKEIRKGKNLCVKLPEPVPVHIVYWTVWVDRNGALQFRDDVYGIDKYWDQTTER